MEEEGGDERGEGGGGGEGRGGGGGGEGGRGMKDVEQNQEKIYIHRMS